MTQARASSEMRADPRRWWALVVLSMAVLLVSVDNTILAVAIPSLSQDLSATAEQLLWIGDIYSFVLAGLLITMGNIGDRVGRKRLLSIGLVAFAACSVLAAFSPTAETLILSRALLGVAGATLMPSTLSLIRHTFPNAKERTFAISVWSATAAAGGGLGPLLGGFLLEHYWWGSVFLVNVPIAMVILGMGAWALRESRNPNPGPLDLISVALSLVGILTLVAGIKEMAMSGFDHPETVVFLLVGLVSLTWFVRRQLRLESPLMDIRLFRIPAFGGAVSAQLISVFGLMGVYFFLAQQFQLVDGDSPLQAGLQLLPAEVAALCGALLAGRIINRFGRKLTIVSGISLGTLGLLGLGVIHLEGFVPVTISIMLVGLGFGASLTATADAILTAAPPERAGSAGGVAETAYELGTALGIAILGSILGAWYRRVVEVPADLPPEASAAVGDSLTTTYGAIARVPTEIADQMLAASRIAFTDAFAVTCLVAAGICGIGALVAYWVLPKRSEESAQVEEQ